MVDVVTHPLAPSLGLSVTAAVSSKEARKYARYPDLVSAHKLEFTPMALSTFGHLKQPGAEFASQAVGLYASKHNGARSLAQSQFNERLAVVLLKSVGERLLAAGLAAGWRPGNLKQPEVGRTPVVVPRRKHT